jgi:hypothetical protein
LPNDIRPKANHSKIESERPHPVVYHNAISLFRLNLVSDEIIRDPTSSATSPRGGWAMEEETVVAASIEKCWGGVNGGCCIGFC